MSDRCLVSSLSIPGAVADLEKAGITLRLFFLQTRFFAALVLLVLGKSF